MVLTNRRSAREEQRTDAGDDSETRKAEGRNGAVCTCMCSQGMC